MGKLKRLVLTVCLMLGIVTASMAVFTMAACGEDPVIDDVTGSYYGESGGKECGIDLNGSAFSFTLTLNGEEKKGTYTFDGTNLYLTFSDSSIVKGTITKTNDRFTIQINVDGTQFEMGTVTKYDVNFKDGNSVIATVKVVSGKKVTAPVAPAKAGYAFIGWYDGATFATVFDFDGTAIYATKDIFARYVEIDASKTVYNVSFDAGEGVTAPADMKTVNGKIYELPVVSKSGATFAGWWVSFSNEAAKLSYKYEGQELANDVTLFAVWDTGAPLVSVDRDGTIKWTAKGANNSYTVEITLPDGTVDNLGSQSQTTCTYDFKEAGEYKISVTLRGQTMSVYYNSKSLARVSGFKVEGNVVKFNGVPNAKKYLITVVCGNDGHNHADVDLGAATEYDFSSCEMTADGIKFTVKAVADGYVTSVSEEFIFTRALGAVTNLTVDNNRDLVTWDPVENATYYVVEITNNGNTEKKNVAAAEAAAGLSMAAYSGEITVSVYPVAAGYATPDATSYSWTKTRLAAPQNLASAGYQVSWTEVAGAKGYVLKVGDKEYETAKPEYTLTDAMLTSDTLDIAVKAKGTYSYEDSQYSTKITVNVRLFTAAPTYAKGTLSWNAVIDLNYYEVKVNDGEPVRVTATTTPVTLTKKGDNVLSVRCVYKTGGNSEWVSATVYGYSVKVTNGNDEEAQQLYKAANDTFDLEAFVKVGYTFDGWFDTVGGAADGGKKFTDIVYPEKDLELYAVYHANTYTVTLVVDNNGILTETTKQVTFDQEFTLPVPESKNTIKTFGGWYLGAGGTGTNYTAPNGKGVRAWNIAADTNLYMNWLDVFKFNLLANNDGYAVLKGLGINYVSNVKIPASYEGLPVKEIPAGAFDSCSSLEVVALPNTLEYIAFGSTGGYGIGSAFYNCANLRELNVYEVDGVNAAAAKYFSFDGVVIYRNEANGETEIGYYPYAKAGKFTVPDSVTAIPASAFRRSAIEEVEIPYTVKEIGDDAFYMCDSLGKVTFLPEPENVEVSGLTIGKNAFGSCYPLTGVVLPKRLQSFETDAFTSCRELKEIGVEAGGAFKSDDGVILKEESGVYTVYYCPRYRDKNYVITDVKIKKIGEKAFRDCDKLTEFVVPEWITEIGKEAFYDCDALSVLTFNGKSTSDYLTIKESAFYYCSGIGNLSLPANLTVLEDYAFGQITGLTKVTLNCVHDGIEYSTKAFATTNGTVYVTELELGPDVAVLDINGIFGSTALQKVTVDPANQNYSEDEGVLYNKNYTRIVYYPNGKFGDFVMREEVQEIGPSVFKGKLNITNITITKNVREIGESAFEGCTNLETLLFEDGEDAAELNLGKAAFKGCNLLNGINLPKRLRVIGDDAFNMTSAATYPHYDTLVIPEGVTEIGHRAFSGILMQKVSLPSTVTKLSMANDGNLDDNLPSNMKTYPSYVPGTEWYYDTNKTLVADNYNIDIFLNIKSSPKMVPNTLKEITVAEGNPNYAVLNNVLYKKAEGKLTEVYFSVISNEGVEGVIEIPNTVSVLHDMAFYMNFNITEIKFQGDRAEDLELSFGSSAFASASKLTKFTLASIKTISANMFRSCSELTEVFIPNTVTKIEKNAFKGCGKLKKLTFEGGGTTLEIEGGERKNTNTSGGAPNWEINTVFSGCDSLEEITLPSTVTQINDYTFANMRNLQKVVMPGVESIGKYAFAACPNLTTLDFGANSRLTTIGSYVFGSLTVGTEGYGNTAIRTGITTFLIPEGVTSIGNYAFNGSQLQTVSLPASLVTIGDNAFYNVSGLETLTIAPNCELTSIGESAFSGVKGLTSLDLTGCTKLTTIGNSAFSGMTFSSFTVPKSVTTLGATVFGGCKSLTQVIFEAETEGDDKGKSAITNIGANCFTNSGLTSFKFPTSTGTLTLGTSIFNGCKDLVSVELSESVTSIDGVFTLCYSVRQLIIPESNTTLKADPKAPLILSIDGTSIKMAFGPVPTEAGTYRLAEGITQIEAGAFKNQKGIKKIILPSTLLVIGANAFENCWALEEVCFAEGSATNLETICAQAFQNCASLSKIDLGNKILRIGYKAFSACHKLKTITLREGLTSLAYQAFTESGLESITLPSTLVYESKVATDAVDKNTNSKYNGDQAFASCANLKSVTISDGLTWLGQGMFQKTAVTEITIPSSVTTLYGTSSSYPLFGKNNTLTTATINGAFKNATNGAYMFAECTALTDVSFGATATVAVNYMFYKCSALKTVDLSTVTTMGTNVFQYCTSLTGVTFGAITNLPNYTFQNCSSLTTIDLTGITSFGTYLFSNCTSLSSVTLDNAVTALGNYMFQNCTSLQSISLPSGLNNLGTYTFQYSGLKSIVIPDGVTVLGTSATAATISSSAYQFDFCSSLETVTLPKDLTLIGGYVFRGCSSLKTLNYKDGENIVGKVGEATFSPSLKQLGNYSLAGTGFTKVVIPATVTAVGTNLFNKINTTATINGVSKVPLKAECTNLTSVELLSNTVTTVPASFVANCPNLQSVLLTSKVTKLDNNAFQYCTGLKTVRYYDAAVTENDGIVGEENKVTLPANFATFGTNVFYGSGIEEVTIPSKVLNLGTSLTTSNNVFQKCESLKIVNLHSAFTKIGRDAFSGCVALEEVNGAGSVTMVGNNAFSGCKALHTIDLSAVTDLGTYAFRYTALTQVNLSAFTNAIPNYAFADCPNLVKVTLNESVNTINQYAFSGCESLNDIDLSKIVTFGNSAFNGAGLTSINLAAVTSLGDNVFDSNASLTQVTLNDELTSLSKSTFRLCTSLQSITLPTALTSLGSSYAFNESGITSITIPAGVTVIPSNTFNGCADLASITFLGEITEIGSGAFNGCGSLTAIALPESLTTIGGDVFLNCGNLATVELPASVNSIGVNSFGANTQVTVKEGNTTYTYLTEHSAVIDSTGKLIAIPKGASGDIVIPEGVTGIAGWLFNGKNAITSLKFPSTLASIDANAFAYYQGALDFSAVTLTSLPAQAFRNYRGASLTLPAGITAIGNYAFQNCINLTSLTLPESVTSVGNYAFQDCTSLTSLTIPEGVTTIGEGTFKGCAALANLALPSTLTEITGTSSNYVFDGLPMEQIAFPEGVTKITYALKNNENLKKVIFPSTLTTVTNAFDAAKNFTALTEVIYTDGATAAMQAFTDCATLAKITLSSKQTAIPASAFVGTAITEITLPAGLTSIGATAFKGTAITTVVIPASVTSIGNNAFENCELLTSVTALRNEEDETIQASYGKDLFAGSGVVTARLLGNFKGSYVFENCTTVETVELGEGIAKLDSNFFKNCTALTSVNIPSTVTEISSGVFDNCVSLTELVIPVNVDKLYAAFAGWTKEQKVIIQVNAYDGNTGTAYWYRGANFSYEVVCVNPVYATPEDAEA